MATVIDSLIFKLGLDPSGVRKGLDQAKQDADKADQHFDQLGAKWGRGLMGLAARMAAPILGGLSIGKMLTGYMSDVASVAQMTGRYSTQLDEWRIKRAQLQRVTREDLDLYIKTRKALTTFQISLADLSAKFTRMFAPALKIAVDWLNKISAWLDANGHNVIRFLTVVAGILTALLLPAIIRMGRALLTNPLTWIIVLIGLLAVAIDDLIVYMRGGKSQFAEFWRLFGTGAEISDKLAKLWDLIKEKGAELLPWLLKIGAAFAGFKIITTLGGLVSSAFSGMIAMAGAFFNAIRAHPFALLITAIVLVYSRWGEIVQGAKDLWSDFSEFIAALWDRLISGIVKAAEGIISGITSALNAVKNAFAAVIDAIAKMWDNMISGVASAVKGLADKIGGVVQGAKEFLGLATSEEERQKTANAGDYRNDPEFLRTVEEIKANRRRREALRGMPGALADVTPPPGAGAASRAPGAGSAGATGGNTVNNNQVINVNGAGDPDLVAQKVYELESGGGYTFSADSGVIQ